MYTLKLNYTGLRNRNSIRLRDHIQHRISYLKFWLPVTTVQWTDFIVKQFLSSIFPIFIFMIMALTRYIPTPIPRYDMILLSCLLMQYFLVKTKLETWRELCVITLYHLIGLALEIFKTSHHCWAYPGSSYIKIGCVPLYSGFMYSSVASYVCQAWRRLDMQLKNMPSPHTSLFLAIAIYANFFTEHIIMDLRWGLILIVFLHFRRTKIAYKIAGATRVMPAFIGLVLVAFCIWFAENFLTFMGAWQYPNQTYSWQLVHTSKVGSWFLLVVITFLIVSTLKHKNNSFTGNTASMEE